MNAEEWRVVPEFPDYEASSLGRIRSNKWGRQRIMTPRANPRASNHLQLKVSIAGRPFNRYVHQLVAFAFLGPRSEGQEVRHLNGDPSDNRVENLAYGTQSENCYDRVRHGTHPMARKTECLRGHPFDEPNTYWTPDGRRDCRICRREHARKSRARKAAA